MISVLFIYNYFNTWFVLSVNYDVILNNQHLFLRIIEKYIFQPSSFNSDFSCLATLVLTKKSCLVLYFFFIYFKNPFNLNCQLDTYWHTLTYKISKFKNAHLQKKDLKEIFDNKVKNLVLEILNDYGASEGLEIMTLYLSLFVKWLLSWICTIIYLLSLFFFINYS